MRARAAGLVLLAIVREAGAAECKIDATGPAPYQDAVFKAATKDISHADVNLPAKIDGFNRSVSLEGMCDNAVTTSTAFACESWTDGDGRGEFYAGLTAASAVKLRFGGAVCPLTGISIYKTDKSSNSDFKAEMRLQFDGCMGSPKGVSNAAVVVGIDKDPEKDMNLLKWSRDVCQTVTTTTAAPAQISQQTNAFVEPVGDGSCDATERRKIENVTTQTACKLQCMGSATSAQVLGGTGCTGFAFNEAASGATCVTYSGSVTKATSNSGWKCFNLSTSVDQMMLGKSTAAPPTVVKDVPEELYVQQALGTSGMAYLHEISPPKDAPDCFKPMWWFKLEDRAGKPISVSVKEADWDKFLADERIPTAPKSKETGVSAPMVLDRVLFNTCTKDNEWGQETCFVEPTATVQSQCRSEELTGAIVSGVLTSIFTWILVGVIFKLCSLTKRTSARGEYTKLDGPTEGTKGDVVCDISTVALLSLVAAGGAFGCCMLSMEFLNAVLRSAECYDFDEFLVVILCVVIATAITIICILAHMAQYRHAHPLVRDAGVGKPATATGSHLMLVDVEDGKTQSALALDSIQMMQQGGTVTGFRSHNSPLNTPNSSFMASGGPVMTTGGASAGGH